MEPGAAPGCRLDLSVLALAYLGDAVYELSARKAILENGVCRPSELHRRTVEQVRARTQARMGRLLEGALTDEEKEICRRGRNAKGRTPGAGGDVLAYRLSTGLESLLGYLYLTGRGDRAEQIQTLGRKLLAEEDEHEQS